MVPLLPEEIEHYRWLLVGLLDGAERLTMQETVRLAATEARELAEELLARIELLIDADRILGMDGSSHDGHPR